MTVTARLHRLDEMSERPSVGSPGADFRSARHKPLVALIRHVSPHGFRAEVRDQLPIGSRIGLELPALGLVPAEVVWRIGYQHGFEFTSVVEGDVSLVSIQRRS